MSVAGEDEISLTVPALPEYLRLARVTAAGLASRLGFTFDQVEDLRLAIDELCFTLTGGQERAGTVHVRFIMAATTLEVRGQGLFNEGPVVVEPSELSRVILDGLVDEHAVGTGPEGPTFRMVKRRQPLSS